MRLPALPARPAHPLWREVTSGELFASALHLTPQRIRDASQAATDAGRALKDSWKSAEDGIREALHLPQIVHHVSAEDRDRIAAIARGVGYAVGFAGAGVLIASAAYKLHAGIRQKEAGKILDGLVDLTAGAAVAGSAAAWAPAGLVLGPLAAVVGIARGGFNATKGYRNGASRAEIQGFLDAGNNALVFTRLLSSESSALGLAAMVLAPIAGAVQLARGYWDISRGVAENSNEKKIQGLADVCAAVGLAASAFSVAAVPGVALVGIGSAAKILYQFSPRARRRMDRWADKITPRLASTVTKMDRVVDPVLGAIRRGIERVTGVKRGDEPVPADTEEQPLPAEQPHGEPKEASPARP